MGKKKSYIFLIVFAGIIISIVALNNNNNNKFIYNNKIIEKKAEDLTPITKERALKILEYEYGSELGNTEKDIKRDGKYYVVDLYIKIKSDEEHIHTQENDSKYIQKKETVDGDVHKVNLGIHKIDVYTGEISKPK